jgi:5-methyltetrahydrofolate--homocysteine methyltransferase
MPDGLANTGRDMSGFLAALRSGRVLLMDGAMGTELWRAGLPEGMCGEIWNIAHPGRVRTVHKAYFDAGAEVLLTNTFQANRSALSRCWGDLSHHVSDYITPAKQLIKSFTSETRFALVTVGPIVDPPNNTEFPNLREVNEIVEAIGMADTTYRTYPLSGLLIETCSSPRVRFAVKRALQSHLPVLLSLTYQRDAKGKLTTFSGHAPEWFAQRAKKWGVTALGVNCGRDLDMSDHIEIVRRYRRETDLPLFARPNAGTPTRQDGRWIWPYTAESMAARLPELIAAGATMIGGCCGTTPEYIAAFRRVLDRHARQ